MARRIVGLNDRETLQETTFIPFQIKVNKGKPKPENVQRAGADLGTEFRLELKVDNRRVAPNPQNNAMVKAQGNPLVKLLQDHYDCRVEGSYVYVKELNIVPYSDSDETIFAAMAKFKGNRPLWFCDRETRHTKFVGERNRPVKGNDPCLTCSPEIDCPQKCQPIGNFYFYIFELLVAGHDLVCCLNFSGLRDQQGIPGYFDKVRDRFAQELGLTSCDPHTGEARATIRKSPFIHAQTRSYIVYRMFRYARRNSFKKDNYPVMFSFHPVWETAYQQFLMAREYQALGQGIPRQVLTGVHGIEFYPEDIVTIETPAQLPDTPQPQLPSTELNWQMSSAEIDQLREAWQSNNWTPQSLAQLLEEEFGIRDRRELRRLSREQFTALIAALNYEMDSSFVL